ncbi:hypothetical protein AAVH_19603 [Aphelenchoides avenae]|nr:hypothetical protein AAVH_19603 [Aphelenchus avenae]
MRSLHAKLVEGFAMNDVWREIFYSQFQCPNCYRLADPAEDFRTTFHVAHPTCADCSQYFKNAELFVERFTCRPQPAAAQDSRRRCLRSNDVRSEVFRWLSRARVDTCQLACREWHVGIDWQWRTLALHSGKINIESDEGELWQKVDGYLTFSIERRLDDSELEDERIFHFSDDPHRDSCLIRNHLRNFFASDVTLHIVPEWVTWLRAMFAGLSNCRVDMLKLVDVEYDGQLQHPHVTQQFIESARPLMPRTLMINLGASQLEAHLRQGFLDPERLGTITSVFINPHMPNWQLAKALEPEPEDGIVSIEPAWVDDLFLLGDRYVRMEYDLEYMTSDFRRSSVPNVLLDVAKKFSAADDTSDFVRKFDVLVCNSGVEIRAPKERPDVGKDELRLIVPYRSRDEPRWDAYYISNSSTNDDLTILLKQPRQGDYDIAAFRLQRGRAAFEADANGE